MPICSAFARASVCPEDYPPIGMLLVGHRPSRVDAGAGRRKTPARQIFLARRGASQDRA